jgi:hypothetical protein
MHYVALMLHPESSLGRSADLLHDRSAAQSLWQPSPRLRVGLQGDVAELAILLHGLERHPIGEDHAASPEIRTHID